MLNFLFSCAFMKNKQCMIVSVPCKPTPTHIVVEYITSNI